MTISPADRTTTPPVHIRVGQGTLSFLVEDGDGKRAYHPYDVKEGMSIAANLREAFRTEPYLRDAGDRAVLSVATPIVLIPLVEYNDMANFDAEDMYGCVITGHKGEVKVTAPVEQLDAVAVFPVNNDLRMVVGDHFHDVEVRNVTIPVWEHLYNRYFRTVTHRRLFLYFHDKKVDVCCFETHRLRFANVFDASNDHDVLYYILYVWKQLGMNQRDDELHIVGDLTPDAWLVSRLKTYVARVYFINPSASLNRSPLADIKGMPFDLMLVKE